MRRKPLRVEQGEFARPKVLYERHERNLRCVSHAMEHRFPKKSATHSDTVQSTGELTILPSFHRMGMPELIQAREALNDFAINPSVFSFRAGFNYFGKRGVDSRLKSFLSNDTT